MLFWVSIPKVEFQDFKHTVYVFGNSHPLFFLPGASSLISPYINFIFTDIKKEKRSRKSSWHRIQPSIFVYWTLPGVVQPLGLIGYNPHNSSPPNGFQLGLIPRSEPRKRTIEKKFDWENLQVRLMRALTYRRNFFLRIPNG